MPRATPRIKPPFSWLGPFSNAIVLAVTVALGAAFRFWQLSSLPPGLGGQAAASGLQSLKLLEHSQLPAFTPADNFAPAWVWLQALAIHLAGPTALALRWWPAILGTLSVISTWLWLQSWFGRRVAWVGALIIAVTPWTVTLSRSGSEAAALPALVTLTFWLATISWRQGKLPAVLGLIVTLIADLFFGPLGWAIVLSLAMLGGLQIFHDRHSRLITRMRTVGGVLALASLVAFGIVAANSLASLHRLPSAAHLTWNVITISQNAAATFLMLFAPGAGDQNYQHNLAGQPMLNAFLGLMFITGIIVSLARLQHRRYRWLLGSLLIFMIPAIVTTTGIPNASRAILLAPIAAALAAVGVSYLLELWYATFPINSAARSGGQAAMIVLLGLSVILAYTQYFRAWGQLSEVYSASNDNTAQLGTSLTKLKSSGQVYVVAIDSQRDIINYLAHRAPSYHLISTDDLIAMPNTAAHRLFYLTPETRDAAVKTIKAKYPGGVLRPHYSLFNQTEMYYSYEITP